MRQFLFIPILFAASVLLAQSKMPDYTQNQAVAPPQKPLEVNCYVRKYDGGLSAFRRGDYRAALRLFEEAKNCPEAQSSSRRLKELEARIEYCNIQLGRKVGTQSDKSNTNRRIENVELTGRKFNISAAFTRNTDPNCFQLTMREADRAFRDSCWDDAAKLYRAAKNCADANQADREQMNHKIESCKAAAEDELLQKEQKAVRTARHAIAANSADDAMDLLKQGNRSLAWRLADFANTYIAPDDNPACLEAMYAAYHYQDQPNEKTTIHPPFCYQLMEGFSDKVQFKFSRDQMGDRLTAIIPEESQTVSWALPSMKLVEGFGSESLKESIGFEIAPDGSFMNYGVNFFNLPNGQRQEVPEVTKYCFSDDGSILYYENVSTRTIQSFNLKQTAVRVQQQRKSANNIQRISNELAPTVVDSGLLVMQMYHGELWLGYYNRVEVLARDNATGGMSPRMTWYLGDSTLANAAYYSMKLYPESREMIYATSNGTYYYFLNLPPDDGRQETVLAGYAMPGQFLACTGGADPLLVVTTDFDLQNGEELMKVYSPANKITTNQFYTRTNGQQTNATAISADGRWILSHSADGQTRLWSLKDACINPPVTLEISYEDQLSPNGNHLFSKTQSEIKVFDADDLKGGALLTIPTLPDAALLPMGSSNNWVVYINTASKLSIRHLTKQEQYQLEQPLVEGHPIAYAFDPAESRFFAFSPGDGWVFVTSLPGASPVVSRNFGGEITAIQSIPGTGKLLIVIRSIQQNGFRYTVKVWDFSKPEATPQVVRLQNYTVQYARVSEQGDRIALSNGTDIRLYSLDNIDNEAIVIEPSNTSFINDMAFRPDGMALVSGDIDGSVHIWDVATGQSLLHFFNVWDGEKHQIYRLGFAYGGTRLRLLSPGRLFTASLDAYTMRDVVQSGDRWLTSFSSAQIRQYNLDIAFKYPGNFDRLADSQDFPLIRSFFQYFRDQSISSNNIEQVRTYCERAFTLFELLGENGQGNFEPTMLEMYEDYVQNCLLRNNTAEASRIIMHLERRFNRPDVAILAAAHTSLVQHDLVAASRLYTDYLLRLTSDIMFPYQLVEINTSLTQFQEYGLLDTSQIRCICEVFQQFNTFENLCPADKLYTTPKASAEATVYQYVFHVIDSMVYSINSRAKVQVFERAYQAATTLEYPNPVVKIHPLETIVLTLASAYLELASFEQNSPKTPLYYEKAVNLLQNQGPFKIQPDSSRLNLLMQTQLLWGKYLSQNDKPADATLHFNAGLQAGKKLGTFYGDDEQWVGSQFLAPFYLELCLANLMQGKPADAQKAYDQAHEYLGAKLKNILTGHIALLENNEIEAFINYGSIATAEEMGEAIFQLNRMAELLPAHRAQLLAFVPRLKQAFLANHTTILPTEVDYWQAQQELNRYIVQDRWDSTYVISTRALRYANLLIDQPGLITKYLGAWHDQSLSNCYYILGHLYADTTALSEVIRYSDEMLAYLASNNQVYRFSLYFYSNLAHALWLRNRPGDQELSLNTYRTFLTNYEYDGTWELLLKDFRDLHRAGIRWPNLKNLIQQIKPEGLELTPEDWRDMGE